MAKHTKQAPITEKREREGVNRVVNLNEILDARGRTYLERTKIEQPNYSWGDLLRTALREFLDRAESPEVFVSTATTIPRPTGQRRTAAEIAASIAGVRVGINQGPVTDVSDWEVVVEPSQDLTNPFRERCAIEFGDKILATAARTVRGWARWDWEQRYNHLRELRGSQAGT